MAWQPPTKSPYAESGWSRFARGLGQGIETFASQYLAMKQWENEERLRKNVARADAEYKNRMAAITEDAETRKAEEWEIRKELIGKAQPTKPMSEYEKAKMGLEWYKAKQDEEEKIEGVDIPGREGLWKGYQTPQPRTLQETPTRKVFGTGAPTAIEKGETVRDKASRREMGMLFKKLKAGGLNESQMKSIANQIARLNEERDKPFTTEQLKNLKIAVDKGWY